MPEDKSSYLNRYFIEFVEIGESDWIILSELNADLEVQKFCWLQGVESEDDLKNWILKNNQYYSKGFGCLLLKQPQESNTVGIIGLRVYSDCVAIYFRLFAQYRNQGRCTSYVKAFITQHFQLFKNSNPMIAEVHPLNFASQRVLIKNQFSYSQNKDGWQLWKR